MIEPLFKNSIAILAGAVWCAASFGCPQPQPPHRDGDAAPATPESACANVAAKNCAEGANQRRCATVLAHIVDAGLEPLDLTCITNAKSVEALRACPGGPACVD